MSASEGQKEIIDTTFYMNSGKIISDTISKEQEKRIVKGILSGEVIDKDGDLIPIEEFAKFFKTLIRRQTPILLKHQPIHVGNLISLEKTTYEGIPAVLVEYQILNDFSKDHETWEGIVSGKYFGMSFTGEIEQTIVKCDANKCHKERKLSAIYEITVTDRPANQISSVVDYLTKEYDKEKNKEAEEMTQKEKNKDLEKELADELSLSKETLQKELKSLGEGIASEIKEGFKGLAQTIKKEEAEVKTPTNPTKDDEVTEEEKPEKEEKEGLAKEANWEEIKGQFSDEIKELVAKELKAQTSSISTPTGSLTKEKNEVIAPTRGLPSEAELVARYT